MTRSHPKPNRRTRAFVVSIVLCGTVALSYSPVLGQADNLGWRTHSNDFGTTVQYPAAIFSVLEGRDANGVMLSTTDGRAQFRVYTLPNERGESPGAFLRRTFSHERSKLSYDRIAPHFFAISMRRDGRILYGRCNFSSIAGGSIHCIELRYPQHEKRAWDAIVTRISRSLRPLEA
jgi:hypothetical protein